MKLKEIAERLVVSKKTVYEWLRSGLIKGTLTKRPKVVGGHDYWDISEEELKRYLKQYEN